MNYCYRVNVALTTQSKILNKRNQAILWLVLADVMFLTKDELKELFKIIEIKLGLKLYKCSSIYASIKNNNFELSLLKDRFDNDDIFIKNGLLENINLEDNEDHAMYLFLIERKNDKLYFKYRNRKLFIKEYFFRDLARKKIGKLYQKLLDHDNIKKKWVIDIANIILPYKTSIFHPIIINIQSAYSLLDEIDNETKIKKHNKYNHICFLKNEFGYFLIYNNQYKCICCELPPAIFNTNKKMKIDIVNDNIFVQLDNNNILLNTIYNAGNQSISDLNFTNKKIKKVEI